MIAGSLEVQMFANIARLQQDMDAAKRTVSGAMAEIEKVTALATKALGALGIALSVREFAGMIKGSIEATARLHDLAIQTGATVESLNAMRAIGKLSETGADSIAQAMNKLAKNMAVANESSKGTGQALKAIGVDFASLQSMRPDDQMKTIAAALNKFEDGAGKSAVAMTLFGKEGAKLLPFLKDLATEHVNVAKVTAEQAAMADEFADNLARTKMNSEMTKTELAMGLTPGLNAVAKAFIDVLNGSDGVRSTVRDLSADGSLKKWATETAKALSYLTDIIEGWIKVAKGISVISSSGGLGDAVSKYKELGTIFGAQTFGSKFRDAVDVNASESYMTRWKRLYDEQQAAWSKKDLSFNAEKDGYDAIIKAARERIALMDEEKKAGAELTESEKARVKMLEAIERGELKKTSAARGLAEWELELAIRREKAKKAADEQAKKEHDLYEEYIEQVDVKTKLVQSAEKETKSMRETTEEMGLSDEALLALRQRRIDDTIATEEHAIAQIKDKDAQAELILSTREHIAALEDRKRALAEQAEAKKVTDAMKEQASLWKSIDDVASQTFVSIFQSGKSAFDRLRDTLKNGLYRLIYEMTIKRWIIQIAVSVGGAGVATAAFGQDALSSGSSILNIGSGLSSGYNLISGGSSGGGFLGNLYSNFATSGIGSSLGLSTAIPAVAAEEVGGVIAGSVMSEIGAGIGTALPWVGGILAVGSLLSGMFSSGGAPKHNAGTAFIGTASGITAGNLQSTLGWSDAYAGQEQYSSAIYTDVVRQIVAKYAPTSSYDVILGAHINDQGKSSNQYDARVRDSAGRTIYDYGPDMGKGTADWETFAQQSIPKLQIAIITDAFRSANADYKAIADALVGTSTDLTDALKDMTTEAATALQANLAGVAAMFDTIKSTINPQITGEATVALANLAGGFTNLTASINSYYDNYIPAEEKADKLRGQVQEQFDAWGVTMPRTRAEFRALVEGLDTSTEFGQRAFVALMNVSGAFAQIVDSGEAAVEATQQALAADLAARQQWQDQLDILSGRRTSSEVTRANQLASVTDEATRAIMQQVFALEDQTAAEQSAAAATAAAAELLAQKRELDIQLMEALGNSEAALAARRQDALAALDESLRSTQLAIWAAQDAAAAAAADQERQRAAAAYQAEIWQRETQARAEVQRQAEQDQQEAQREQENRVAEAKRVLQAAYSQEAESLQEITNRLGGFAKAARSLLDTLVNGPNTTISARTRYATLKAGLPDTLARLRAGDETALPELQRFVEASRTTKSSFVDYARDFAMVVSAIDGAASTAEAQERLAKQQLKALKDQIDALANIDKSVMSVTEALAILQGAIGYGLNGVITAVGMSATTIANATGAAAYVPATAAAAAPSYYVPLPPPVNTPPGGVSITDLKAASLKALGSIPLPDMNELFAAQNATNFELNGKTYDSISAVTDEYNRLQLLAQHVAHLPDLVATNRAMGRPDDYGLIGAGFTLDDLRRLGIPGFASGTDYAARDMLAVVHEGERIIPAVDNARLMASITSSDTVEEIRALRQEVQLLRAEARATASHTSKTAKILERVTPAGDALATREVAA